MIDPTAQREELRLRASDHLDGLLDHPNDAEFEEQLLNKRGLAWDAMTDELAMRAIINMTLERRERKLRLN